MGVSMRKVTAGEGGRWFVMFWRLVWFGDMRVRGSYFPLLCILIFLVLPVFYVLKLDRFAGCVLGAFVFLLFIFLLPLMEVRCAQSNGLLCDRNFGETFKHNKEPKFALIRLGGIYCGFVFLAIMTSYIVIRIGLAQIQSIILPITAGVLLVGIVALSFAPLLVAWHGLKPCEAVVASFTACGKNFPTIIVNILVWSIAITIPLWLLDFKIPKKWINDIQMFNLVVIFWLGVSLHTGIVYQAYKSIFGQSQVD